jgi:phosphatidate cytidylyltransferase|tara:strand:- start:195 stop:1106 length:912 start_codon:yes stop_codon:yes gene_type:complete
MNFLKFNQYFVSEDDDGTFWPGVIEVPSESEIFTEEKTSTSFIKNNPRLITGLLLFIFVTLFFINLFTAFLLLIIISLVCSKEWSDIFDYGNQIPYAILIYSPLAPILILYFYDLNKIHYSYFIFPIGLIIYSGTFLSYGIYEKFGSVFIFHTWFSLGVVSIAYFLKEYSLMFTYLSILSISISDIAAYEIGRRYGKTKLSKNISPNKTIEGLFAGLFCGSALMTYNILSNTEFTILLALIISIFFISFGVLGDLFMSRIKRSLGIKDSSNTLPGHGGFLDRIDSYLISFPFLLLTTQLINLS